MDLEREINVYEGREINVKLKKRGVLKEGRRGNEELIGSCCPNSRGAEQGLAEVLWEF